MNDKTFFVVAAVLSGMLLSTEARAAFDASVAQCPDNSQFIAVDDVTATGHGNADSCYGAFGGNDALYEGQGIEIAGGEVLSWIGKYEVPGVEPGGYDGNPLFNGLFADGEGNWTLGGSFDFDGTWMIVFKQGTCWAGWTFGSGTYSGGTYETNYGSGGQQTCAVDEGFAYSHVSIWGTPGTPVPEPTTLALLGLGLVGFGVARRRMAAR